MKKQKGFSLIELLIVVAIILIIAAIAIPNLMRSKMAANEASAVGSVRTLVTSSVTYATTYPEKGFEAQLSYLGGAGTGDTAAGLIDSVLANGTKSGYSFTAVGGGASGAAKTTLLITAIPVTQGTTGIRSFCATQDGVVRYSPSGATPTAATCIDGGLAPLQ